MHRGVYYARSRGIPGTPDSLNNAVFRIAKRPGRPIRDPNESPKGRSGSVQFRLQTIRALCPLLRKQKVAAAACTITADGGVWSSVGPQRRAEEPTLSPQRHRTQVCGLGAGPNYRSRALCSDPDPFARGTRPRISLRGVYHSYVGCQDEGVSANSCRAYWGAPPRERVPSAVLPTLQ